MTMTIPITNRYPLDIEQDHNKHRRMNIIVLKTGVVGDLKGFLEKIGKLTLNSGLKEATAIVTAGFDVGKGVIEAGIESQKQNAGQKRKATGQTTEWGCSLPLPNELNENQSHQWDTSEGLIGSTLGGLADTSFAKTSINKLLGEVASKNAQRKQLVNPGYFQDYKGTKPREFNFTWDLIPNSKQEADEIFTILYKLKKYTLPTTFASGLGLESPYIFDIQIGNDKLNMLMNMNNVVCVNMSIGYSADNSLQMMGDGTPKHMTLQMSFAERSTVYASDYLEEKYK